MMTKTSTLITSSVRIMINRRRARKTSIAGASAARGLFGVVEPEGIGAVNPEEGAGLPVIDPLDRHIAQPVVDNHRLRHLANGADAEHIFHPDGQDAPPYVGHFGLAR